MSGANAASIGADLPTSEDPFGEAPFDNPNLIVQWDYLSRRHYVDLCLAEFKKPVDIMERS